jgi:hypothetical protein
VASSYKVTIQCTGSDYQETITRRFGSKTTRSGTSMTITLEADNEESAKRIVSDAIGSGNQLFLEAKKV